MGFILGRYYSIAGRDFVNALASLSGKDLVPMDGSLLLIANLMTESAVLRALICIGFFLWYYLLLFVMVQTCVRILFAWSMDRLAPEFLTNVDPRTASPYAAMRFVLIAAAIAAVVSANITTPFLNYIALFSFLLLNRWICRLPLSDTLEGRVRSCTAPCSHANVWSPDSSNRGGRQRPSLRHRSIWRADADGHKWRASI
jgi:hypothetical protein